MANESDVRIKHPMRQCKVVREGWYGPDGQPVVIGQKFDMPAPDALSNRALGRIVFA